jgi:hypothetical protein
MKKEIEIKLRIDAQDFSKLVQDLDKFQFEKTYGFFTNEYKNMEKWIFPRIKEVIDKSNRTAYITVKVKNKQNTELFVRDEYEFMLENIDDEKIKSIREMFFALEYTIEHIFEKKRYRLAEMNNCDVVVDVLPFGYFLEVEWEEEDIEKTIKELNLDNKERINKAYLRLWDDYKKENNLTGECIFVN